MRNMVLVVIIAEVNHKLVIGVRILVIIKKFIHNDAIIDRFSISLIFNPLKFNSRSCSGLKARSARCIASTVRRISVPRFGPIYLLLPRLGRLKAELEVAIISIT